MSTLVPKTPSEGMETSADPRQSLAEEEIIDGKYKLVRLIGKGAMGAVWEAHHIVLGRRVAIKFIEPSAGNQIELVTRFDNEARAAASIHSKYIVAVEHHGITDHGRPYIVMEYLDGEALDQRLEREGRLSLEVTANLLVHVARGLSRAHEQGIVHRDLKPANIIVVHDEEEGTEIAKVFDFGIAKLRETVPHAPAQTQTGTVLGTPYYMAPEQARGLTDLDGRADVWSLGVIAYQCVTGVLPFDGKTTADLLVNVCVAEFALPSKHVAVPPGFDAWMTRALARDQEERFSTILEAAQELASIAQVTFGVPPTPGSLPRIYAAPVALAPPSIDGLTSAALLLSSSSTGSSTVELQPSALGLAPTAMMPAAGSDSIFPLPLRGPKLRKWLMLASLGFVAVVGVGYLAVRNIDAKKEAAVVVGEPLPPVIEEKAAAPTKASEELESPIAARELPDSKNAPRPLPSAERAKSVTKPSVLPATTVAPTSSQKAPAPKKARDLAF